MYLGLPSSVRDQIRMPTIHREFEAGVETLLAWRKSSNQNEEQMVLQLEGALLKIGRKDLFDYVRRSR